MTKGSIFKISAVVALCVLQMACAKQSIAENAEESSMQLQGEAVPEQTSLGKLADDKIISSEKDNNALLSRHNVQFSAACKEVAEDLKVAVPALCPALSSGGISRNLTQLKSCAEEVKKYIADQVAAGDAAYLQCETDLKAKAAEVQEKVKNVCGELPKLDFNNIRNKNYDKFRTDAKAYADCLKKMKESQ